MVILSAVGAYLAAKLVSLSPFIIGKMKPILIEAGEDVWQHAYPLAVNFVKDLADNGKIDGLDKHKVAVQQLEEALIKDGKFVANGTLQVSKVVLGQIVLSAYANEAVSM